mgnify:CR=1 FL=1
MSPRFLAVVLLALPASAQQFVRNTSDIPVSTGTTEQVDYADVDLDGVPDVDLEGRPLTTAGDGVDPA